MSVVTQFAGCRAFTLSNSAGARVRARALVSRPVAMAGAGKKPKGDDDKPRGFPRCGPARRQPHFFTTRGVTSCLRNARAVRLPRARIFPSLVDRRDPLAQSAFPVPLGLLFPGAKDASFLRLRRVRAAQMPPLGFGFHTARPTHLMPAEPDESSYADAHPN